MDGEREEVRRLITRMLRASNLQPTALARKAGLAPSTITRFLSNDGVKHIPSTRTLAKLAAASGVPLPQPGLVRGDGMTIRMGERMRKVRSVMAASLSDDDVAALLGWDPEVLEDVFAGRRPVTPLELYSFSKRMRVSADFILSGDIEKLPRPAWKLLTDAYPELLSEPAED